MFGQPSGSIQKKQKKTKEKTFRVASAKEHQLFDHRSMPRVVVRSKTGLLLRRRRAFLKAYFSRHQDSSDLGGDKWRARARQLSLHHTISGGDRRRWCGEVWTRGTGSRFNETRDRMWCVGKPAGTAKSGRNGDKILHARLKL